jgi:hypothetical protein
MKHLSTFIHAPEFVHTTPVRDFCHETPAHTLAATLAHPGAEYVIYVADKREKEDPGCGEPCSGRLRLSLPAGRYQARLYAPAIGGYTGEPRELMGGEAALQLEPFVHDVVIHIQAE